MFKELRLNIPYHSPPRRICELVPPEEASHPAFKIMRRAQQDNKKQKSIVSHPGSVAGEDGELSDVDPSESGSMGSRSTTSKTRKTIAERQAEYQEARTRIFMNFEEKEKKERSASASSSSPSLISPSEASSQVGAGDVAGGPGAVDPAVGRCTRRRGRPAGPDAGAAVRCRERRRPAEHARGRRPRPATAGGRVAAG